MGEHVVPSLHSGLGKRSTYENVEKEKKIWR